MKKGNRLYLRLVCLLLAAWIAGSPVSCALSEPADAGDMVSAEVEEVPEELEVTLGEEPEEAEVLEGTFVETLEEAPEWAENGEDGAEAILTEDEAADEPDESRNEFPEEFLEESSEEAPEEEPALADEAEYDLAFLTENDNEEVFEIVDTVAEFVYGVSSVTDALYNAFELGLLPAIRNQHPYGDCWAFAGIGAMETDLIIGGQSDTGIDLSEYFLAYFIAHLFPYPKGGGEGDALGYEGTDSFLNSGGDDYMVLRTLANLLGTVNEEDAPHPTEGEEAAEITRYAPIAAQITGAYFIDANRRDEVKQAILEHGAVSGRINMVTGTRSYEGGCSASFRTNGDRSCLYGNYEGINHEVMLVGWDDDFAISNFSADLQPPQPGAWLARNSWGGEGYGPNGYFWISYYDASLLKRKTTAYDATNTDMVDFCYSYDKTPYPDKRYLVSNRATVKQTFHVDGSEALQAVGVETASENLSLGISVRANGVEVAGGAMFAAHEGFYRVALDEPYEMGNEADIEVVVTYTAASETDRSVRVPFAPASYKEEGLLSFYNESGEGGFWFNNRWYEGDSRLKLYTKKLALANEVEALTLNAESLSLRSGETALLTAAMTPEDAVNPDITWTSSDVKVATVDANGRVTAGRKEGKAVITAMTNRGVYATCAVRTTRQDYVVLKSGNVEFAGLIHMLITCDLIGIRESDRGERYIVFRRGDAVLRKCALSAYDGLTTERKSDGLHEYARYNCPVPIVYYRDEINIRVEDADGREIETRTGKGTAVRNGYDYALQTYAENKIANGSAAMKRLAQALKDYGIAALQYVGKETGGQAVSPAVDALDVDGLSIRETVVRGQKPAGVSASQTVVFDSDNALMVKFRLPAGKEAGDYVFRVDGELQTPEGEALASGGREVALMVSNIAPNQLNTAHTFSISDGRETFTVTSSVLGYAKNKAHNGSANMKILAKALCNYYTEALEYIGE